MDKANSLAMALLEIAASMGRWFIQRFCARRHLRSANDNIKRCVGTSEIGLTSEPKSIKKKL